MSSLSRDEVARVAELARIDLSPEHVDKLAGELAVIVTAIEKVSTVATADVPATSHPLPLTNVFREDVVRPGLTAEQALAAAPASEQQRFMVPRILGDEQ